MRKVKILYNPYLPELRVTIDNHVLSPYSTIMTYRYSRVFDWCVDLFEELYRELNTEYEIECYSTNFVNDWLQSIANNDTHCISFIKKELPLNDSIYERLKELKTIGYNHVKDIIVPVHNASSNKNMVKAFFDVLEEESFFDVDSENVIRLNTYPIINVKLREIKYDIDTSNCCNVMIVLCETENDDIPFNEDSYIFVLIMGIENRFLYKKQNKIYFQIDSDTIGEFILSLLEESVFSPIFSNIIYEFVNDLNGVLTENKQEYLEVLCQATPICKAIIPKVLEVGRKYEIRYRIIPSDNLSVKFESSNIDVIRINNFELLAISEGTAEITIFINNDAYPVFCQEIQTYQRIFISEIKLSPYIMYLPVGGVGTFDLKILPQNAENRAEIRWKTLQSNFIKIDPFSGVISAYSVGEAQIIAYTKETRGTAIVKVQPIMEDIVCSCSFMELKVGLQKRWQIDVIPEGAYGEESLRIISSDKNIAEYNKGYVIGKGIGKCKIYVKSSDGKLSRELYVVVKKDSSFW